uniref:Uncharacterized protein n=1 Tax=Yersinia enterocolitica TaxID=630 RepID=B0RL35_YEREN|nr:hypothetical protein [Yersinia enterocolitica]
MVFTALDKYCSSSLGVSPICLSLSSRINSQALLIDVMRRSATKAINATLSR